MIYQFPNINIAAVEIWKWMYFSPNILLCMWPCIHVGIKLIHASKSDRRKYSWNAISLVLNAHRLET